MKKQPEKIRLTIVILNHNTKDLLKQCLQSISGPHQVIVVDNNSSDGSVEVVQKNFPKIELIKRSVNDGFARGNNAARKIAGGKYILFLNSDTKLFPDTLSVMLDFMDSDNSIGVSTCLTELPNGKLYYACHRGFPTPANSLLYFLGLPSNYNGAFWPLDKIHEIDACSGTFLLIRHNLLDKIGWYDEDYFAYGEDIEMCYRIKELGYKVMFNPTVKIIHYWGASSGLKSTSKNVTTAQKENSEKWNAARYQAMKIFYDKHYRKNYSELFRQFIFIGANIFAQLRKGKD